MGHTGASRECLFGKYFITEESSHIIKTLSILNCVLFRESLRKAWEKYRMINELNKLKLSLVYRKHINNETRILGFLAKLHRINLYEAAAGTLIKWGCTIYILKVCSV